jgi:primosomal protein N' (replication factor Y)
MIVGDSMVAHVLVELGAKTIDKTFTYIIPDNMIERAKIGVRVLVSFGKKQVNGFILGLSEYSSSEYELKEIIDIIDDKPVLNDELLELGKYISDKTLCYLIEAYQTMLPLALKAKYGKNINIKQEIYIELNINPNDINKYKLSKSSIEIINLLLKNKVMLKKDLTKVSISSVNTLLSKSIIKEVSQEVYRTIPFNKNNYEKVTLNDDQKKVVNQVKNSFNKSETFLLYGVTGSGKTEVYMELVDEVIRQGKQAIILVPEISLTPQMVSRFKNRFDNKVAILHSGLSDGEKYDEWRKIERNEVSIAIGARSAIFAPFNNIGIIVIDEEHATTYKQENHPRYNTIDIAIWRSNYHHAPVLLGSATPSLESFARAQKGVYKLLEMPNRINNKSLPKIDIIDMKEEVKKGNRHFSSLLFDKINDKLKKNEQVILLLNRRGYSPIISCRNCGYTAKCPNCDISLTYHKYSNTLRCHYCGYGNKMLDTCPSCHGKDITTLGMGTEKIEEELNKLFPSSKVIRMDIDTTTKKGSHAKILDDFRQGKYNILLGTQMIAKGLDFPNVTLVGVLNGDTSLNIPDFRSGERTFQLLSQVAGRAGRKDLEGEVVIQTYNPEHYSIECTKHHDYVGFYNQEMLIRKKLKYPPYFFITLVRILSKDYNLGIEESKKVSDYLKNKIGDKSIILGPSTANLYKVNNIYRFQCIIKYKEQGDISIALKELIDHYRNNPKINIEVDIDPIKI